MFSLAKHNRVSNILVLLLFLSRFVFTCCGANASISASTRKRKTFGPLCLCLCVRQGRFHGEIKITMFALGACVASENQAQFPGGGGGRSAPYNGLYGEVSPERGTFSPFRYMKGWGNLSFRYFKGPFIKTFRTPIPYMTILF